MIRALFKNFGMRPVEILAAIPFVGSFFATMNPSPDAYIQYGALGLCGVAVVGLFKFLHKIIELQQQEREELSKRFEQERDDLVREHRQEREELTESIRREQKLKDEQFKQNYQALNQIASALKDRPCICNDDRISGERK